MNDPVPSRYVAGLSERYESILTEFRQSLVSAYTVRDLLHKEGVSTAAIELKAFGDELQGALAVMLYQIIIHHLEVYVPGHPLMDKVRADLQSEYNSMRDE